MITLQQYPYIHRMASFLEELWSSIFTPGTTPTLLVATNASFAALQLLLLILLIATYSIHFFILSLLCGGLWYAINWFARELQLENAKAAASDEQQQRREKSLDPGSDTETESVTQPVQAQARTIGTTKATSDHFLTQPTTSDEDFRRRRSQGDSSGYVSTDSEWEKVSEDDKRK